jgi:stage V sporulation protein B
MNATLSETASITPPPKRAPLWRSGVHVLLTSIVAIVLAVANNIIIARALGSAGKGSYDLALTTAMLLTVALGFSLPVGVTYVVARGRANLRRLAWQLAGLAMLFGALATVVLYVLRLTSFANSFIPPDMGKWAIVLIVTAAILAEIVNYWRAMLNGRQEIIQANRSDLISRAGHVLLLLLVAGVMAAQHHRASPALFIAVYIIALMLANLFFLKPLGPALQTSRGASGLREVVAYSFTCYLGNFTQFLNYRLDVFIVTYFSGVQKLGLYTLAVSLGQMIWLVSKAAATVLLPNVAASQEAAAANAKRTAQITRIAFMISAASALLLAVFAAPLVPWIFGEEFRPSVTPLLLLLPGIVAFSAANVIASYLAGIGKPQLNLYVALAGVIVTVVLDVLLIPRFDIAGAAIASTLSYLTSTLFIIWFFMRVSKLAVREILWLTRQDVALGISLLRSLVQREKSMENR